VVAATVGQPSLDALPGSGCPGNATMPTFGAVFCPQAMPFWLVARLLSRMLARWQFAGHVLACWSFCSTERRCVI
jgi:hypothetical protein